MDSLASADPGPLLLGVDDTVPIASSTSHQDEEQVHMDVNRAFVYYPTGSWPPVHQ